MKRKILIAVLAALCLVGCARAEDPYRVDTVVYIPADPTAAPTEVTVPAETAEPTVAETEAAAEETEPTPAATEPEPTEGKKTTSSGKNTSSNKNTGSGKKPSSGKNNGTAAKPTEPPVTEPAPTEPQVTEAPAVEPEETEVPATEPEPTDPPLYDISGYSVGSLEYAMKDAINAYRTEAGLGELSLSSRLCAIASCRGYEISQVWSHTRPDGRSYSTVLEDYGYGGWAQELLVYVSGSGDAQTIIDKWMSSDSHKQLLLGGYSTIGIGVYRVGGNTYVACLLM